jgi:hypothetical protein
MTNKFQQWKEAMKNVPPERLLKINLQGFALQTIGLIVACTLIIISQTIPWWIVFAFGFSIFNTVSGFISTYQQYHQLIEIKKELNLFKEDKSPHRNKAKEIKERFGLWAGWISFISSAFVIYYLFDYNSLNWGMRLFSLVVFAVIYYLIYFKVFYNLTKLWRNNGTKTN